MSWKIGAEGKGKSFIEPCENLKYSSYSKLFPRAGRDAPRDFPRAKPEGNPNGSAWTHLNDTDGSVWSYLTSSTICSHYISIVGEFWYTIAIM